MLSAKESFRRKFKGLWKWMLLGSAFIVLVLGVLVFLWLRHLGTVHQHCIKQTGTGFRLYADSHDGRFPLHTNGFGDAMMLLVAEDHVWIQHICGPGDDGKLLQRALETGEDVDEATCTRVYVQGFAEGDDPNICLLFDRDSSKGGDHRYGYGPRLREVLMLDGSMQTIVDERWPEFSRKQVELLVKAGWDKEKALAIYPAAR